MPQAQKQETGITARKRFFSGSLSIVRHGGDLPGSLTEFAHRIFVRENVKSPLEIRVDSAAHLPALIDRAVTTPVEHRNNRQSSFDGSHNYLLHQSTLSKKPSSKRSSTGRRSARHWHLVSLFLHLGQSSSSHPGW